MTKEPFVFLQHILESIELIEKRVKNIAYKEFISDVDLQDMIIRRLEIIGEAVKNLPQEFRQKHSDVDWQDSAGMRNALIHGYFQIDLTIVWDTVSNDLPPFKKQIEKIINEYS